MKFSTTNCGIHGLAAGVCYGLLLAVQAVAQAEVKQPSSRAPAGPADVTAVERDLDVMPAGCTDSGCKEAAGSRRGGCQAGCSCYEAVCCPKRVTEEVKKHCWKVKSELVCIPGFRFHCHGMLGQKGDCCNGCDRCTGGESCCASRDCAPPSCGRVRCIKVLEKHEYTCEECGYEWEARCVRTSKGCYHSKKGCNCPSCGSKRGCCADSEAPATDVQLTSAEPSSAY